MKNVDYVYQEIISADRWNNDDDFITSLKKHESLTDIIIQLFINGCYWSRDSHNYLWIKALTKLAHPHSDANNSNYNYDINRDYLHLDYYPALLTLYVGGIAAIANKNYKLLADLFTKTIVEDSFEQYPIILVINNLNVFNAESKNKLPSYKHNKFRLSDYLYGFIEKKNQDFIPQQNQYKRLFCEFEYLLSLVCIDLLVKSDCDINYVPFGCFEWNRKIVDQLISKAKYEGDNWMPVKAGLFNKSIKHFFDIKNKFDSLPKKNSY